MGANGIALHKPGVCEAKHAQHKLHCTNKESVQQTTGPEGKALKLKTGPR